MAKYKAFRLSLWDELEGECPMCGFIEGDALMDKSIYTTFHIESIRDIIVDALEHADLVVRTTVRELEDG